MRENSVNDMLLSYLGGVESDLFRHSKQNRQLRGSEGGLLVKRGDGNDEGYIRTTSILDMECGEVLSDWD